MLPSSHNSSSVYTNDSAYTNISATVGEHSVPPRLLLSLACPQFEPSVYIHGAARCVCVDAASLTFAVVKANTAHI